MDEMEEGELSDNEDCTTDAIDAPYNPLARPSFGMARQQSITNDFEELEETGTCHFGKSLEESDDETPASRILLGHKGSSSGSGSDSDDSRSQPSRKMKRVKHTSDNSASKGGETFHRMATEYQRSRSGNNPSSMTNSNFSQKKRGNNIWGNLLNEEILTADMSDIAVGRSAKVFRGDRGAESYNYLQARVPMTSRTETSHPFGKESDKEMNGYWSKRSSPEDYYPSDDSKAGQEIRRDHAIIAGKKRSIKEHLGRVRRSHSRETDHNNLDDLSIPPPGVPRTISDVPADILNHINSTGEGLGESMESETIDASDSCYTLGEELAAKLSEPKIELIVGVVELVGAKIALNLFAKTQVIEKEGGMMIKNGQRRRTPGGVFLHLLRELATSSTDPSVDPNKIKKFFAASEASSQRHQPQPRPKMSSKNQNHGGSFQAELAAFQRLSKRQKQEKESLPGTSKSSSSNPLPDLIAFHDHQTHKDEFDNAPPEAPPNSVEPVERALSTYDDDYLPVEVDDFIEYDQSA